MQPDLYIYIYNYFYLSAFYNKFNNLYSGYAIKAKQPIKPKKT